MLWHPAYIITAGHLLWCLARIDLSESCLVKLPRTRFTWWFIVTEVIIRSATFVDLVVKSLEEPFKDRKLDMFNVPVWFLVKENGVKLLRVY